MSYAELRLDRSLGKDLVFTFCMEIYDSKIWSLRMRQPG